MWKEAKHRSWIMEEAISFTLSWSVVSEDAVTPSSTSAKANTRTSDYSSALVSKLLILPHLGNHKSIYDKINQQNSFINQLYFLYICSIETLTFSINSRIHIFCNLYLNLLQSFQCDTHPSLYLIVFIKHAQMGSEWCSIFCLHYSPHLLNQQTEFGLQPRQTFSQNLLYPIPKVWHLSSLFLWILAFILVGWCLFGDEGRFYSLNAEFCKFGLNLD